ncbi:tetratricopeptide repeat protein [Limibaculum sp. M0105]|uniref:Tetratricopeptide repeat protein n=1 Tax=Thermohalobaculum xanthum TaxID=2753746 RepID=A0A8J7SGY0_9RHOB|nr:tetratricopeptide repeat protein [Thermohalobaculum xanthum]MBK0400437.1 tetratricopeptide repeat protein [Thermohalobaculum xanthum]
MASDRDIIALVEGAAKAGDHAGALKLCEDELAAAGDRTDLRALAARTALRAGKPKVAAQHAWAVVEKAPEAVEGWWTLVRAVARAEDAHAAIEALEAALEHHPDDVGFRCELGRLVVQEDEPARGIRILQSACDRAPDRPEPQTYLALALFLDGQAQPAVAAGRSAIELGESRPGPLEALGKELLDAGALEEARLAFERVVKRSPRKLDSYSGLSRAAARLGDTEAARNAARALFRHCPIYGRKTSDSVHKVLVLECLYDGYFRERRYGPDIFRYMNFVSGLEPGRLSLHHYYLNRDEPLADLRRHLPFDAVINNIANGERVAALGLAPVIRSITDELGVPVINPPEAVLATTRLENYRRLGGAKGFVVPKTVSVMVDPDYPSSVLDTILEAMSAPFILRPVHTHAGKHAVLIDSPDAAKEALEGFAGQTIYAIEYFECRDADGIARRYRFVCVGGQLIPVNMHAAHHWNVHGDERSDDEWRARGLEEEERAFLDNPAAMLGRAPSEQFRELVEGMPLDIFGFDFCPSEAHGTILFEANSSMSFSTRRLVTRYPYLAAHKTRSQRAINKLIESRIGAAQRARDGAGPTA